MTFRFEDFLVFGTLIVIILVLYYHIGKNIIRIRREKKK